jgi:hypothetical protein
MPRRTVFASASSWKTRPARSARLAKASNALMVLLAEGLVDSEPVVINDNVHTLYRLSGAKPPIVH